MRKNSSELGNNPFFAFRCETPGLEMTRERLEGQPDIAASAPVTPSGIQDYDGFFKIEDD